MRRVSLLLLAMVLFPMTAQAAAPALLHYQGYLTDLDGAPVDGEWVISFRLYDGAEAAVPFYEETRTVYPESGVFAVVLGAQEDNALQTEPFQDGEVWLGVEINGADGPVELEPRQRVVSHPYALYSGHAQLAEQATNALSLGGTAAGSYVTVTQLADMTVSPDDLPGLIAEYGITEEELPALLEALGIGPGGLDEAALQEWLLVNGYAPGPHFSGDYLDLVNAPDLSGFCQSPCYSDAETAFYLELNGYLPADELVTRDGSNALEGDWDIGGHQLLNLVVHNAASETPPEDPAAGQLWWDTTQQRLRVFDGDAWQAVGTGDGVVAGDLECDGCVGSDDVKFKWALSTVPGGPAVDLECAADCVSDTEVSFNYAASDSKAGSALLAKDVGCVSCIEAEETNFNWAVAGQPGGIALMAESAVNAEMLEGKQAADFEPAGAVADHEGNVPHLSADQHQALTGGGETTLHSHANQAGNSAEAAKVRTQKGDYNLGGNQSVEEYVHVFGSNAPKVYLYLYGKEPTNMLLPNHNHGSHYHTHTSPKAYNDSSQCQKACTYNTSNSTVGNGSYPLTNISATSIPKNVEIWVDGVNVTAQVGDPHQLGAPHFDAGSNTWGAGNQAWHSNRLDLSNATIWDVGEHTLEFKETGNVGGRLLYYVYVVHPAAQSAPLGNDTCGTAQALEFNGTTATVSATTEDMLGENKAVDDLAPAACGGTGGGDLVYSFELTERTVVTAGINAVFTPRIYLLSDPCGAQAVVGCGTTSFETDELDPGTYYVVVDSDAADQKGDFNLTVQLTASPLPENDVCETVIPIAPGQNPITVEGTTKYALDQYSGTCGGDGSADVVYSFEATDLNDDLTVTFSGGFGSRLYLRAQDCNNGFQLSCSNTGSLSVQGLTPGLYFLVVDGASTPDEGAFSLDVTLN